MDRHEDVRDKLERVLFEMIDRGSQVLDKVYLEMMISHLAGKNDEDYSSVLKAPFLQTWVQRSFDLLNTERQNTQLYAFTLRLLALMMNDEWQFLSIMETDVCSKINEHLQHNQALRTPHVKLAHVQVLQAMLKHTTGTKFIVSSRSWQLILGYCLENQTIYVVRDALRFMNEFTHKVGAEMGDEKLCLEIVGAMLAPIDAATVVNDHTVRVDSDGLQRTIMPCLKTIAYIMDYCIRNERKSCIPHILCKQTKCRLNLWRLTDMTKDETFFKHIVGAMALLNFVEFVDQLDNAAGMQFAQNQFGLHFFNQMRFCLVHRHAMALLSIAKLYHLMWTSLGSRVPEEIELEGNRIKFENQIITLQLTPIMFSIVRQRKQGTCESEVFDSYIMKLFDISTDHTLRVCYAFRDLLTKNRSIVADVACKSIQGILAMKSLHRDRAVYVFQALSYTLKDFAYAGSGPEEGKLNVGLETSDRLLEMPQFLSAILTGVHAMVKEHHITWKESIESMCLMNFMLMLLNKPNLPTTIAVQALKLTQLAVEHFLSPNLALLVENLKDSALENLGPMIVRRLHDSQWEVRDSALELLASMADIALLKFPAFQQHILDHKLCDLVVQVAKNDSEAFVRATALNCLCPMVNVKLLWDTSLAEHNLMGYLLDNIHTENEGIVRKEYCLLISEIYRLYKVPNAQFELIFPTMAQIAVNDLYWEAKVNAITFWRLVFLRQFRHNGVIDGAFPAVTFSKKHKKIVTLTPKEIALRLDLILDELTARGGLGVLLECLADACDVEVVKAATQCALRVQAFLQQYDYKRDGVTLTRSPSKSPSGLAQLTLADAKPPSPDEARQAPIATGCCSRITFSDDDDDIGHVGTASALPYASDADRVIANIVSQDDINLLGSASVRSDGEQRTPEASSSPHLDPELFRRMRSVEPAEFLRRLAQIDLSTLIERRGAWIRKNECFDSLLEDMMFSLQIGDANNADCY